MSMPMYGSTAEDFGLTPQTEGYRRGQNDAKKELRRNIMIKALAHSKVITNVDEKLGLLRFATSVIQDIENDLSEVL